MAKAPKEQIVDLYELDFLGTLLREHERIKGIELGKGTDKKTGVQYTYFHTEQGEMLVKSELTGQKYIMDWNAITTIANHRGINRDPRSEDGKGEIILPTGNLKNV